MSVENILVTIMAAVALGASIWSLYSKGKSPGVQAVIGEVASTLANMDDLVKAAREVVQAAEQLWDTGQIPEMPDGVKNPKFYYAAEQLRKLYPSLTDATIEMAIESAVFWLKKILPALVKAPVVTDVTQ